MTKQIRFEKNAAAEHREAEDRYESELDGLGAEFADVIDDALGQILEVPRAGSPIANGKGLAIRRVLVRRFPYAIIYEDQPDAIRVLAIAHTSRRQGYWMSRI